MKISIITASFNSGHTIRDTIFSVLNQDFPFFEHIIVDGGSSDDTLEIIRDLEPRYNGRLKYISEKDEGIYDAMNKGIDMATGEIIGILNSDDFFSSSNVLSKVVEEIGDHDAIYGDIHFVSPSNLRKCVRYYSSKWFKRVYMIFGYQPAHPSFYCRKEIYNRYGNFDLDMKIASDFELLFRFIYVHNIKIKYIPFDFVTMRIGGASTNGLESRIQILKDHYHSYKKHNIKTGYVFDMMRYPLKVGETILTKKIL